MSSILSRLSLNFNQLPDGRTLATVTSNTIDLAVRDNESGGLKESVLKAEIFSTFTVADMASFTASALSTFITAVPTDVSIRVGLDHVSRVRIDKPV